MMCVFIIDVYVYVWLSVEDFVYEDGKAFLVFGAANEFIVAMDVNGVCVVMIV